MPRAFAGMLSSTVTHAGDFTVDFLVLELCWSFPGSAVLQAREPPLVFEGFSFRVSIMDYFQYIERNPQICGGEPVIKGTRVTLRTLLASLAEGASIEEITADFPTIGADDVRAVIAFAAASAEEDLPLPAIPEVA
jgi:uncharacterized protein (DUF433 family)